jgi:hypothetical protein
MLFMCFLCYSFAFDVQITTLQFVSPVTQKLFNLDKEWKKYWKMFDDKQKSSPTLNPNTFFQTIDFSSMCQHNLIQKHNSHFSQHHHKSHTFQPFTLDTFHAKVCNFKSNTNKWKWPQWITPNHQFMPLAIVCDWIIGTKFCFIFHILQIRWMATICM